jgi:RNA polymerase sigma-70 factor (ECF subfamily)
MNEMPRSTWIHSALQRYEQPLLRYVLRFTRDPETARDVVQDTFLKLCTADRTKVDGHLAAWLYTVARNHALNVLKKEGRMETLKEGQAENLPNGKAGPRAVAEHNETQRLVLNILHALPDKQQEACRLKFEDELTYREISQIMGVSLGTVNNLLTAALDTIRQRLKTGNQLAQEV